MRFRTLQRQTPGDPIEAKTLNGPAEQGEWCGKFRAAAPLAVISTASGPLLRWAGQTLSLYVAKTTSSITARSGDTPGTGTVSLQSYSTSDNALADMSLSRDVFNFSGGDPIDSGLYCIVIQIAGVYWLASVECAS